MDSPANEVAVQRQLADYKPNPNVLEYDAFQSITNKYSDGRYAEQLEKMKESNLNVLQGLDSLAQLELIDIIERLGLEYHFEREIKGALDFISISNNEMGFGDLHATSLHFRLLRKHGYHVSQDVFKCFKDVAGSFEASMCRDTKGMLSLYEASHLGFRGDNILDEARDFSTRHLKNIIERNIDLLMARKIAHALELPLHWRAPRIEARWYIETYEEEENKNTKLLDFAKLEFNVVQAKLLEELKDVSRWYTDLGLFEKLPFSRDRLVEGFYWFAGCIFEPESGHSRKVGTQVGVMVTTIDDIFDIYGSLDELILFTDVVDRWDIGAMEQLPEYMKITFLALYNLVHQIAYVTLKEKGWNVISYLKKTWADLCKAYLVGAKWRNKKYIPTLEEYMDNAWLEVAIPPVQFHIYFHLKHEITKEAVEYIEKYPYIIRQSTIIIRLVNDLGTSPDETARGDDTKSIQCYMHQAGVSEAVARAHLRNITNETWKEMNEELFAPSPVLSKPFIESTIDIARMAEFFYQNGNADQYGSPSRASRIISRHYWFGLFL